MTCGASEVAKASFGKDNNMTTIFQGVAINLRLDSILMNGIFIQPLYINLAVEMSNVANDGIIGELFEVLSTNDVLASSSCDNNVGFVGYFFEGCNLVSFKLRCISD